MIVSFSGIDSSGKTTQIILLEEYCKLNNISVRRLWGKARGTPGVMLLKQLLRQDKRMDFEQKMKYRKAVFQNGRKQKLLLIASLLDLIWYFGLYYRIQSLKCDCLILDRYVWDTYIEVTTEFKGITLGKWWLWKLVLFFAPKPQNSFLFTIPPEISIERDKNKNDLTVDSLLMKQQKIAHYLALKDEGKWSIVIDGLRPIEEIHSEVKKKCFSQQ